MAVPAAMGCCAGGTQVQVSLHQERAEHMSMHALLLRWLKKQGKGLEIQVLNEE